MGRPLNKKYFGNRNIGTGGNQITGNLSNSQNYSDDRIGGEGIASVTLGGTNNSSGFTAGATQISFAAPTLPGGVTATGALVVTDGIINGSTTYGTITGTAITGAQGGTGLAVKSTSGSGTGATFTIAKTGAGTTYNGATTITVVNGGSGYAVNDTVTISGALLGGATPANDLTFTLGTSVVSGRITGVTITEKGSGYTAAPTVTVTTGTKGTLTLTAVRTTDSGAVGSATNQENAIVMYANTSGSGSTGKAADVIKQVSTNRYKVKTADGIRIVQLGTDDTPASGAAYLVATDANGNTYFVTKLTAHKATLIQYTQNGSNAWVYTDNKAAPWNFDAPSGVYVQIENA